MWAGRLAWLGHLLDVQKVAGPNPVRPIFPIHFAVNFIKNCFSPLIDPWLFDNLAQLLSLNSLSLKQTDSLFGTEYRRG